MSAPEPSSRSCGESAQDCRVSAARSPCPPAASSGHKSGILRRIFGSCAACAGSGAGGALLSHAGCLLAVFLGGASGVALSVQMMSVMILASPAIAAAATAAIDFVRERRVSVPRMVLSAAFGAAIAAGVHHYTMDGHEHHRNRAAARQWFDRQSPAMRRDMEANAARMGIGIDAYLDGMCASPPLQAKTPIIRSP